MQKLLTPAEFDREYPDILAEAQAEGYLALDIETTGLDVVADRILGVSLATKENEWYVLMPEDSTGAILTAATLGGLLGQDDIIYIGHNIGFDAHFLNRFCCLYMQDDSLLGKQLYLFGDKKNNVWDTMAMVSLYNENLSGVKVKIPQKGQWTMAGGFSLKGASWVFLGREQRKYDTDFESWPLEEQVDYACTDARNTYDLAMRMRVLLAERKLMGYYRQRVAPMFFVSHQMEREGLLVDRQKLETLMTEASIIVSQLEAEVVEVIQPDDWPSHTIQWDDMPELESVLKRHTLVYQGLTHYVCERDKKNRVSIIATRQLDKPFNLDSRQQVALYLIQKRGYVLPTTDKGEFKTDEEALDKLAAQHPTDEFFILYRKYKQFKKLFGSYITSMLSYMWPDDSCHPKWNSTGTVTGRYSTTTEKGNLTYARGPALQTIPRPDTIQEEGWPYNPREWFVARPGKRMVVFDLAQAEVRMLAVMSGDVKLKALIESGLDMHSEIAEQVWKDTWYEADDARKKVLRGYTKAVTFGIMYGIGPTKLGENTGLSTAGAKALIEEFYATFPQAAKWMANTKKQVVEKGVVSSLGGRQRRPILVQPRPAVTVSRTHPSWKQQMIAQMTWQACWDREIQKSKGLDEASVTRELQGRAQRQAVNFCIQGSVGEFVNRGMLELVRRGWNVVGQVHDEVLVEVPDLPDNIAALKKDVLSLFEVRIKGVPFTTDIKVGESWACGKA